VRHRNADTGGRDKRSLGEFGELPPSQRYGAAKTAAEGWFTHLPPPRGDAPAENMKKRFARWIDLDETLGKIDLSKLTRARVEKWRAAMAATPVKVNRDNQATPITRARSAGSVNRDISALRAALNHAHDMGHTTSDMAWRVALRPAKNADRRWDVYLDMRQRRALIDKAAVDVAKLLHGLALVPLRPGALADLTVGSLDPRLGVLLVGKDKAGRDRKIKLPHATVQFFSNQAKGKTPNAPLLSRADGKAWDKDAWK
jgi:hypothetical protein